VKFLQKKNEDQGKERVLDMVANVYKAQNMLPNLGQKLGRPSLMWKYALGRIYSLPNSMEAQRNKDRH